ncbi:MAG: ASCH domain-containing protein [Nitrosopumilus sp. B06]|nr:MAG: ASCH domain-containing protein [Nitrosopumilus sp. D6]RNJ80586.1 MAG: ASCH domain-containing protein [Nitrosopumilus sp. B06]
MKCLSVSQPFADLIISGKKTIELRSWNTGFRGEFLVHAPQRIRTDECRRLRLGGRHVTGAIVGRAEICGVKKYESTREVAADRKQHLASREFFGKRYGFVLKNHKAFEIPIPCKGRLGFFDVETPKVRIKASSLVADIIDEEYRYQWIGRH